MCQASRNVIEDFHVAVWRMGSGKLGMQLAVYTNALFIHAISGSQIKESNRRCRTCRVEQILQQQLLVKDQVVGVNGKTQLHEMLVTLFDVTVKCCHLRVRRCSQKASLSNHHPAPDVARLLGEGHQTQQLASSSSASAPGGSPFVRVISDYDPLDEPQTGYLKLTKGTIVAVQPGSRAPPEARNRFQCSYIFAWDLNERQSQGWVPVDVLVAHYDW